MSTHRIRLAGPWTAQVWSQSVGEGKQLWSGKVSPPCPFPTAENCGQGMTFLERIFHPPTNLTGNEKLFLVFPGLKNQITVMLNGTFVTRDENSSDDWQGEISQPPLQTNNYLRVICLWDAAQEITQPRLFQGAILEIHDSET